MTFVITEACIDTKDQSCVEVCPVDCIHFDDAKDRMLYIDPVECIDCGACQPACPVTAIYPEADVPANLAHFTEINALWYQDPDAARARVEGGAAPAPAAAEPAAAEAEQEAAAEPGGAPAEQEPAESAAPAAESGAAAVVVAEAPPAAAPVERVAQVPASVGAHPPEVSTYNLPSPWGFITLAIFAVMFALILTVPGPQLLEIAGVGIGATIIVLLPLALLFGLLFVITQARDLALFSAHHEVPSEHWRERLSEWRRNEESRRYLLNETVQEIAALRFGFPNEENPDLRTFVNLPEPQFGVEPRGTGEKLFPDIVTVTYPGYYPVAIAQVETADTVTPEQAMYMWARIENQQCPLYLYVPAGMLKTAKRYAKRAGLKRVRYRTWRWSPNGLVIREV